MELSAKVLFIGINPSFSTSDTAMHLDEAEDSGVGRDISYCPDEDTSDEEADQMALQAFTWSKDGSIHEAQQRAMKYVVSIARGDNGLRFYRPCREMTHRCLGNQNSWVELDLFYWHETQQHQIVQRLANPSEVDFWRSQAVLTSRLLGHICPEVLIVANASAWNYIRNMTPPMADFGVTQEFRIGRANIQQGHVKSSDGCEIPFFAVPMLSSPWHWNRKSRAELYDRVKDALRK